MSCNQRCNQGRICDCALDQANSDGSTPEAPFDWVTDYFYACVEACGVIFAVVVIACVAYGLARAGFV